MQHVPTIYVITYTLVINFCLAKRPCKCTYEGMAQTDFLMISAAEQNTDKMW
jgi:hypothetical protein